MQITLHAPQLVLFQGHSAFQHPVLQAAVSGTPWQLIQLQGSAQTTLLQAALLQNLASLVPSGRAAPTLPTHGDGDLTQMANLLEQAGKPVVITVHDDADASD